jgi:transposase
MHSQRVSAMCQCGPMIEVAGMLKRRFANIITYLKHRITNATSESINAKIQWVKYTARGFRNKHNFINAIYFHCGGLDLAPAATKLNSQKRQIYKAERL